MSNKNIILDRIEKPTEDDMIFAENLQESLPIWASILQTLLDKTDKENYLSFKFLDGSSLEYVSSKGKSKMDLLEKDRDLLKDENRQLKQRINDLECKLAT